MFAKTAKRFNLLQAQNATLPGSITEKKRYSPVKTAKLPQKGEAPAYQRLRKAVPRGSRRLNHSDLSSSAEILASFRNSRPAI
jgi:hypothetical protein